MLHGQRNVLAAFADGISAISFYSIYCGPGCVLRMDTTPRPSILCFVNIQENLREDLFVVFVLTILRRGWLCRTNVRM